MFRLQQSEITKYDQIFEGLQPVNDLLAGDKVRPVSDSFEENFRKGKIFERKAITRGTFHTFHLLCSSSSGFTEFQAAG